VPVVGTAIAATIVVLLAGTVLFYFLAWKRRRVSGAAGSLPTEEAAGDSPGHGREDGGSDKEATAVVCARAAGKDAGRGSTGAHVLVGRAALMVPTADGEAEVAALPVEQATERLAAEGLGLRKRRQ
jgi:hypothetical protein